LVATTWCSYQQHLMVNEISTVTHFEFLITAGVVSPLLHVPITGHSQTTETEVEYHWYKTTPLDTTLS
jgi:hypothetical protein